MCVRCTVVLVGSGNSSSTTLLIMMLLLAPGKDFLPTSFSYFLSLSILPDRKPLRGCQLCRIYPPTTTLRMAILSFLPTRIDAFSQEYSSVAYSFFNYFQQSLHLSAFYFCPKKSHVSHATATIIFLTIRRAEAGLSPHLIFHSFFILSTSSSSLDFLPLPSMTLLLLQQQSHGSCWIRRIRITWWGLQWPCSLCKY